ncbi:protein ALP1-like [Cornus florida]|uniref:protein ALP1-like n=1 Tax=Cornus florida TaxID=4283 RepID=UPI00289F5FC3|nr:protein ALP1-like [Cornus florida]
MDPQLEEYLRIINTLVGIDDTHYANIIKMFGEDKVWRDIFIHILDERKVGIVDMDIRTILTMYNDDVDEKILALIATVYEYYYKLFDKQRCRDFMLQGEDYVFEILNGHEDRCYENFLMYPNTFRALCRELKLLGLKDSIFVTVEEQVAIFLLTVSHNERNRVVAERFQYSTSTISYHFHAILKLICELGTKIIVPPDLNEIPKQIKNNPKFYLYFKNCVGAIDGTHIHVVVPVNQQIPFHTQNVIAVCSFDMKFTYILAGWERSANDSKILNECIQNEDLNFPSPPKGKFYLVDSRYANQPGFLATFRGQHYHMQEYRRHAKGPRGREKVYNFRHSSLRNIIERCFGLVKIRFAILKQMPPYHFDTQVLIVIACCTLYNFIRSQGESDEIFYGETPESSTSQNEPDVDDIVEVISATNTQMRQMDIYRDRFANLI